MVLRFIPYSEVMQSRDRTSSWARAKDRLSPEVWPDIKPGFRFNKGTTIFTIGSCFARNIEEHLERLGYDVPTLHFPATELDVFATRRNSILNKYTPPSIVQEIRWAADLYRQGRPPGPEDYEIYAYVLANGLIIDNNLAGFKPVPREHFSDRRRRLYDLLAKLFSAEVVVMTPGVAEAWYDTQRGIFIQNALTLRQPSITDHLQFVMLDFESCFTYLDEAIAEIRALNPCCKILLTTSPVPLTATFSDKDVIVANAHAKATLRTACGELAAKWNSVDYFPSFESVTCTRTWDIFESDLLHVADRFIAKIVARLVDVYCPTDGNEGEKHYRASLEANDPQFALSEAVRAVELSPQTIDYHLRLADILFELGRSEEAFRVLEAAQEREPDNPRPAIYVRNALEKLGDQLEPEVLRDTLKRFIRLTPNAAGLYSKLGRAQLQLGELSAAEATIRKLIEFNSTQLGPYLLLIGALRRQGRNKEALTVAQDQIAHHGKSPHLLLQAGLIHLELGDARAARDTLQQAREIAPGNIQVERALTKLDRKRASFT